MNLQYSSEAAPVSFDPLMIKLKTWKDLEPYFNDLLNRSLHSLEQVQQWILDKSKLDAYLSESFAWCYINVTRDSNDKKATEVYTSFVQEITPKVASLENELNLKLVQNKFFAQLPISYYKIYSRKIRNSVQLFSQNNVSLQKEVQLQSKDFGRILSQMTVGMDGQQLTLQKATILLEEKDRPTRRQVYHKINDRILQDTEELEDLFDSLLEKRHQIALNAGFDNYRDYAFRSLERFDYTPEDCYAFHDSISSEILPLLDKVYQARKESLEVDHLRPYDLNIDTKGREVLRPFKQVDELVEQAHKCLTEVDPLFGEVIQKMQNLGHLDLDSRTGKRPGGYNMPLHITGIPFIFMNATNSLNDLRTLMHESGHAVHAYLTKDLAIAANRQFPSEISELAAMTMELFTMEHWETIFDQEEDLQRAKLFQMEMILKVLPWIATIDKFQHWLYSHPKHTRAERKKMWLQILKEFTPTTLDYSGLENYLSNLWLKQLHLFEVPFYYIEYGFAQLGAIALWAKYSEAPQKTVADYQHALSLGYTKTVSEIYEAAGIQFDFSQGYVAQLGQFIKATIDEIV